MLKPIGMRSYYLITTAVIIFLYLLISCSEPEELTTYESPEDLDLTEYTFMPEQPNTKEETSLVFYGCTYFQTTSVITDRETIGIKKHFNSQMKWPCIVAYDTISLGRLKKGEYQVKLEIIDVNPFMTDTVFFSETKTLTVGNK